MKVLSLFDGISCLRVALEDKCTEYLASEIDKHAIKVAQKNFPSTKHLGSVCDISGITGVDLLCGGSPCTDLSISKKERKGLEGERSKLFYEFVRIWKETNPKWFILENVASMPTKDKNIITSILGVEPLMINASLVSAQNRKRLFWTNIPVVGLPEDKGIMLKDILQPDADVDERMVIKGKAYCLTANYHKAIESNSVDKKQRTMVKIGRIVGRRLDKDGKRIDKEDVDYIQHLEVSDHDKSNTITTVQKDNVVVKNNSVRKLTPIECERLQSLPDNYTDGISNTQRYKCLGNAFNVEVIKFILSFIP